ncbi:MAG: PssD/Cps14F family polysaccharide biosynthesis glycosyltransferase [Candidatus Hydrothermarchaeales archaeon]
MSEKLRICLASSAGGHLTELLQLKEVVDGHDHFFVTFKREDTEDFDEEVYFIVDPKRNPLKLIKNFVQSLKIVAKERPDVIITTGAGVVVPLCYIGKLFGAKIIFIESFARITSRSLSGAVVYPIADLFFVQWESMLTKYGKKAIYGGSVF